MVWLLVFLAGSASGQFFVVNNPGDGSGNGTLLGYNFDGTLINNSTPLLSNGNPAELATDGTNLFVTYFNFGVVGKYTTTGGIVNPSLVSGLTNPNCLAISGTNLFVADQNRIGRYTTFGLAVNANLVTNLGISIMGMTVIGTNLFISLSSGRTVAEYTIDGAIVNTNLISGLGGVWGLATDGTNLFVAYSGAIGKYSSSGSPVSPILISGIVSGPSELTIVGTNIFAVTRAGSTIGQYTTSGVTANPVFVAGGHYFEGIAAVPVSQAAPPPATGITTFSNQPVVIWPVSGGNYTLQTTTNLASGNWVTVSNYTPVTGAMITNASSPAFFRLH